MEYATGGPHNKCFTNAYTGGVRVYAALQHWPYRGRHVSLLQQVSLFAAVSLLPDPVQYNYVRQYTIFILFRPVPFRFCSEVGGSDTSLRGGLHVLLVPSSVRCVSESCSFRFIITLRKSWDCNMVLP